MANTITAYVPTIIARTIPILRETLAFITRVTTDFDTEFASIGNSLQIPVTAQLSASDITPSNTAPAMTDIAPTSVSLTLNKFKRAPFSVAETDLNQMMRNTDFIPAHLEEGARAIARQIEDDLFLQAKNIPYFVGTPGTSPFSSNLSTIAAAAKSMNDTLASDKRTMLLSNTAVYNANQLGNLTQSFQRGGAEYLNTTQLGLLQGFDCQRASRVPTFTAGTITTGLIAKASTSQPVGTTAIVCTTAASTGACALVPGDIIVFSGDGPSSGVNQSTYVVTAAATQASAATDVTVNIYPPKKVALVGSETITVKATNEVNLGFDRGAFALGMRAPRNPERALNVSVPFADNGPGGTGMTFALNFVPNYWAETLEIVALYGVTTLRPERAVRMAG